MNEYLQVGDIGTVITLTITEDGVAKNIAAATTKQIIIQTPAQTLLTYPMTFVTDGQDGQLQYILQAGDLAAAGIYQMQVALTTPTWSGRSNILQFRVNANLS